MTQQEFVDQKIRQTLGEMHVQIILLQARIAELEAAAGEPSQEAMPNPDLTRANGELKQGKGAI